MKDSIMEYTPSLFPDYFPEMLRPIAKNKQQEQWAFEKNKNLGLELCPSAFFGGRYGIPLIKKYTQDWPQHFITFSEIKRIGNKDTGVATFDFDQVLNKLVSNPSLYVGRLSTYKCVCEPDLSIRLGDPLAIAIANTFRSHCTSYYLHQQGCEVIPTMKWSSPDSYEVCFSGYEKGGAVIVSTIGVTRDERSRMYFIRGFNEMLNRISPDSVGLYGDRHEWIDKLIPSQLDVRYFFHERFNRMRGYGK
jgi:hypothetical protein